MSDSVVRAGRGLSPLADAMATALASAQPGRSERPRPSGGRDRPIRTGMARLACRVGRRGQRARGRRIGRPAPHDGAVGSPHTPCAAALAEPTARGRAAKGTPVRAWHYALYWVPTVDAERRLSPAELNFLTAVNRWLPDAQPPTRGTRLLDLDPCEGAPVQQCAGATRPGVAQPGRRPEELLRRAGGMGRAPGRPGLDPHRDRRTQRPRTPRLPDRLPRRLRRAGGKPPDGTALERFFVWLPAAGSPGDDDAPPGHRPGDGPAP